MHLTTVVGALIALAGALVVLENWMPGFAVIGAAARWRPKPSTASCAGEPASVEG